MRPLNCGVREFGLRKGVCLLKAKWCGVFHCGQNPGQSGFVRLLVFGIQTLATLTSMKIVLRVVSTVHGLMAILFACAALILIVIAARVGWAAVGTGLDRAAAQGVIEAVGLLAAAVVALQIAQTVTEEEVIRDAHVSAPTRVRRFLSRFLVVVVVSLAIEGLVATFKAIHEDMTQLAYSAGFLASVGLLLGGWGLFIRLNRYAEELEPEAMEAAKREDRKLK
jgi:hypothetical protein